MRNELVDSGQQAADSEPVRCGCGGEAKVFETPLKDCEGYFVQCDSCKTATFLWLSEAEAVQAWNRAMGKRDESSQVERKTGAWLLSNDDGAYWVCSACGFASEAFGADILYHFCPRCGADMRGEHE